MKVLVPTLLEPLPAHVPGAEFMTYAANKAIPPEHHDAEVLVVWGMPRPLLAEASRTLTQLKWVQTLGAGADAILAAGFGDEVQITSGRGLHNRPVAEHTLALILCAARRLHELRDAQLEGRWASNLGGLQPVRPVGEFRTLEGANVLVWGFGSIAQALAPLLRLLGASVTGVALSAGVRADTRVASVDQVDELLPLTDVLVMILPSSTANRHALDARRLALLQQHAWLVNVGRGSTVDEGALASALQNGVLAGAALDVFEEEPLPITSPLWGMRNVVISPHAAGGRPQGATALIEENVRRYAAGLPLLNKV